MGGCVAIFEGMRRGGIDARQSGGPSNDVSRSATVARETILRVDDLEIDSPLSGAFADARRGETVRQDRAFSRG